MHEKPKETQTANDLPTIDPQRRRGRGACTNATGRFEAQVRSDFDDGWDTLEQLDAFRTTIHQDAARKVITTNDSPDVSFDQSINPYRGCEHGCVYCYARPTHCYLGHSAGLDFETELYAKPDAAGLLERELANPRYRPATIAMGTNTDPYQPVERDLKITRSLLEVFDATSHPVAIVTKSSNVVRDVDILQRLAQRGLCKVALSVTTLDRELARKMEPRAATPGKRLDTLRTLHEAGIPTAVMAAPVIPGLNDAEIEKILEASKDVGVTEAGYVLLRLPLEIKTLFREWLDSNYPDRAQRVIHLLQSMHGGTDYDSNYFARQRGSGPYADQIATRFRLAAKRLDLNKRRLKLRTDLFKPPQFAGSQLNMF